MVTAAAIAASSSTDRNAPTALIVSRDSVEIRAGQLGGVKITAANSLRLFGGGQLNQRIGHGRGEVRSEGKILQ